MAQVDYSQHESDRADDAILEDLAELIYGHEDEYPEGAIGALDRASEAARRIAAGDVLVRGRWGER